MNPEVYFSIIIPTYNRADFIKATVESVLRQTFTAFEIIVVDDGSTDNTEEIIAAMQHPKLRYYKKENAERAAARNYGVQRASGNYITFLDSDDYLLPHHFKTAFDFINENNQPPLFYLQNSFVDENGNETKPKPIKGDFNKRLIIEGNRMSCIGVFLKKEIATTFPFNDDHALSGTEDHELWLRLAARYEIKYSNTITACMVQHDNRSVMEVSNNKLITRLELFIKYVEADAAFQKKYTALIPAMKSQAWSYLALHFAVTHKNFTEAFHFFKKALNVYPQFVFQKRFYVIIRHLLPSKR